MAEFFGLLFALACVAWLLIGFFWTAAKVLGFLWNPGPGEKPPASTLMYPRPAASPAPHSKPEAPLFAAAISTQSHSSMAERKAALTVVRREVQRAFNLGLIYRQSYLEISRYIERERALLKLLPEASSTAEPVPETAAPAMEPQPLLDWMEQAAATTEASADAQNAVALPPVQPVQRIPPAAAIPAADVAEEKLARVRDAIARLHEHAQAPVVPDAEAVDLRVAATEQPMPAPIDAANVATMEESTDSTNSASSAIGTETIEPRTAPAKHVSFTAPIVRKTWAERLFTPENVRILQSLGNLHHVYLRRCVRAHADVE